MEKKTVIEVACAWCGADMGEKDGRGEEGVSHGVCEECKVKLRRRPVRVGDRIKVHATGHLREVTVTKVTNTYIWVEYTSPSTRTYHNTKFRRDWALSGTELY